MIQLMLDPCGPDSFIVRADVHILGIKPRISRTLELPVALNLAQLHEVLQAAFGWTDSHLHQFNIGGLIYGAPEFDEDGLFDNQTFEATEVKIIDFQFPTNATQFRSRSFTNTTSATIGVTSFGWSVCRARRKQNILVASLQIDQDHPKMSVALRLC